MTRFPVEKSGAARIGGGEHSEPIRRMLIMPYGTESKSRNADFMFIARKGDTTTLGPKGRCPLSEAIHNLPPSGGHNPRAKGPSTLTPKVCPMAQPDKGEPRSG